jgi:hypothetical protein
MKRSALVVIVLALLAGACRAGPGPEPASPSPAAGLPATYQAAALPAATLPPGGYPPRTPGPTQTLAAYPADPSGSLPSTRAATTPSVTPTPSRTPTRPPTETPTPSPTATPTLPAAAAPPGLVYEYDNRIWRVGPDGQAQDVSQYNNGLLPTDQDLALHVFNMNGDIWLQDLRTGQSRNLTETPEVEEAFVQWWPANLGMLAFLARPIDHPGFFYTGIGTVYADGSGYRMLVEDAWLSGFPAFAPDGNSMAYAVESRPRLYRLDTGASEALDPAAFGLDFEWAVSPAWSPDGSRLAWAAFGAPDDAADDRTIAFAVFDLHRQTGSLLHPYVPFGGGDVVPVVNWSPDGRWLGAVTTAEVPGTRVSLWILAADGSSEHHIADMAELPHWSPDSRQFIYYLGDLPILMRVGEWQPLALDLPQRAWVRAWH